MNGVDKTHTTKVLLLAVIPRRPVFTSLLRKGHFIKFDYFEKIIHKCKKKPRPQSETICKKKKNNLTSIPKQK